MITVNDIISGVSRALNKEFGAGYTNYTEEVKQGLKTPCFFIFCIDRKSKLMRANCGSQVLKKRYFLENRFCIQYLPSSENRGREECFAVAEKLPLLLEELEIDSELLRGTDMSCEVVDGVLSFFVDYNFFAYESDNPTFMEEMERKVTGKK